MSQAALDQVAERLLLEGAKPVSELAKLVPPPRGKSVAAETLVRWIVQGKHKGAVKLEGFTKGQGWYSSVAALGRFFGALTRRKLPPEIQTVNERRAAAAAKEFAERKARRR